MRQSGDMGRCSRGKCGADDATTFSTVVLANARTHNPRPSFCDHRLPPSATAKIRGMGPGVRQDDGETRPLVLAAHFARVLHRHHPLEGQRAQGRPGGRCTRGSRAKGICASAKTTGTGGDNRPSLRDGLRLIGALLGEPSRLPPSPARCASIVANFSARSLGRQDHTISPSAYVPLVNRHIPRPPHSAPRS